MIDAHDKKKRRQAILRIIELRFEEACTLADMMDTKYARREMMQIVRSYNRLAEHALQQIGGRAHVG